MLKYNNVEIDKIKGTIYKGHLLINYEEQRLNIQTNWINLTHYGVPKADKFHTTEESRRYLQIPLIDGDNLKKFIQSLDNHFSSDNFKKKYLDDKQHNFNYIPILKESKKDYPASIKFKIDFYNDDFITQIYHKTNEGNKKCEIKNMNDVKKYIPYKSEIKVIFKINKIWFMSKNYGCQLKLIKILVNSKKQNLSEVEFTD